MTLDWLDAQNSEDALTALAASDTLWGHVQRLRTMQFALIVIAPIALTFGAQVLTAIVAPVAYFGFLMTMLDVLWLNWSIVLSRREAAQAQDRFDAIALSLPRPSPRIEADSDLTRLLELARAQNTLRAKRNHNWYTPDLHTLPLAAGRLACMRESATWDARVRSAWATLVTIVALVGVAAFVTWAFLTAQKIDEFFLRIVAPLTPALVWAAREIREQRDSASIILQIHARLRAAWATAVRREKDDAWLTEAATDAAWELRVYRSTTSPVPNFIYRLFRPKQTQNAQATAGALVREWKHEG